MRKIAFRNRLTVKLLLISVISLVVSIVVTNLTSQLVFYLVSGQETIESSVLQVSLMMIFLLSTAIVTFIFIFILLVRKKIRYLKSISQTVQHIANGKLGLTIEIKGKDELTQLAQNINYMSKELENKFIHERQLEKAKNELITNVSHDLRTPLTSIIGYLNLIKNEQYENKDQLHEYFETIYAKSQRLKHLMDELFEFTRLSSPDVQLNLNKVDMASLLQQIVGEYMPIFEEEQLSVQSSITDEDFPVLIDVEKMVRVYENLFMNAIKYSMKPSDIQISFKSKGNTAILQVSNRVENPPVEDVNKMFERFFRGDKARVDAQGTGLGLSISKRIVELHNGDIRAEYKDGWIIFIVEHPLYK
ncbi:sensor histidine kinase [Lysinibacillus sp. NPDC097287]|uniref:sensor histidine kinase n=1 Tax=Lysinibacillus sp. NPDC097287 TaxID=3364144 RepID=UPI00381774AE